MPYAHAPPHIGNLVQALQAVDFMLSSSDVRLGKKLGAGGAGMVYTGFFACGDTAEANVALKETFQGVMDQDTTEILHEVDLLLKLKHRNIVQVGPRTHIFAHTLTCHTWTIFFKIAAHTHTHTHTHTHFTALWTVDPG